MSDQEQREELSRFLKGRRARLSPADVGLPPGRRRRVPGLRREEVAQLAGIGVSWYTEFESGEARGASDATLRAVADALRLSQSEREYLAGLTGRSTVAQFVTPNPLVLVMMNNLSFPAYLITATWEVIDCNEAFRRIWGVGKDDIPFNAIERLFLNPAARQMHGANFIANIRPIIAMLRSSQGRQPDAESLKALRDRILADDDLHAIWDSYEITSPSTSAICTVDTSVGTFRYETLTLPISGNSYALVAQIPDDASVTPRRI